MRDWNNVRTQNMPNIAVALFPRIVVGAGLYCILIINSGSVWVKCKGRVSPGSGYGKKVILSPRLMDRGLVNLFSTYSQLALAPSNRLAMQCYILLMFKYTSVVKHNKHLVQLNRLKCRVV